MRDSAAKAARMKGSVLSATTNRRSFSSLIYGNRLISIPCRDNFYVFVSATLSPLDSIDVVICGVVEPNLCIRSQLGFILGQIFESNGHSIVISMCKRMNSFGIPPDRNAE